MEKPKLIILTGPTAVGKSDLSIALAKKVDGEIISADSVQVYRGLDIGSAKIRPEEMQGVKHYLIDVLDPKDDFDITIFQRMAKDAMAEIYAKGKIPILVGGTGFYIQSIVYDIDFNDGASDVTYRKELEETAKTTDGIHDLYERLRSVDPKSAEAIHENNVKRVIRALEFYRATGKKISEHNEAERKKGSPYNFAYFVLNDDRTKLYERIDRRVDLMVKEGLLEEVKHLTENGSAIGDTAMQGLGYKEIVRYLNGEYDLDRAIYLIKRETRHFAKRQITWFKREKDVHWLNKPDFDYDDEKILDEMIRVLEEKHLLCPGGEE
ncbi:MAG: tRNA (adenosine(37)-N6)-dimethylallyltransferase MiaA [Lachnospiraceae bacterium]|nr:tRNA (adenosine(37)-N6)-dimethylallyltransferase MiaA [Lachnospiraceae bacterium]